MSTPPAAVVVLAAGEGTRMRSDLPKVLHPLAGRSLVGHAVAAAAGVRPEHLVVVVGHGRDAVRAHLGEVAPQVGTAVQEEQRGTGHAVRCALDTLPALTGTVVVTYGDVPLLQADTLTALLDRHRADGNAVTVLTASVPDPTGYGRVVRDPALTGGVVGIVEHKDADETVRAITEINSGIYAFEADVLLDGLSRITTDNSQGELYLTDVLAIARADGGRVGAERITDTWQTEGVNDRVQLAQLGRELNRRLLEAWMRTGVTVTDPATTWVDVDVTLGRDVVLEPGTQLRGRTTVAGGAVVGPDTTLVDTDVAAGARVLRSHVLGASVGPGAVVGPFSYLRPGADLGASSKVGAFVEMKSSTLGEGSKVPHLSYVGDATIGAHTNIGAATVVVNYDGVAKHRTEVGDHVRVGSDSMLVAPVRIGDGAYTAAGSVITEDVPPGALGIARGRQKTVPGWVARARPGSGSAQAAEEAAAATPDGATDPPGPDGAEQGPATTGTTEQGRHA